MCRSYTDICKNDCIPIILCRYYTVIHASGASAYELRRRSLRGTGGCRVSASQERHGEDPTVSLPPRCGPMVSETLWARAVLPAGEPGQPAQPSAGIHACTHEHTHIQRQGEEVGGGVQDCAQRRPPAPPRWRPSVRQEAGGSPPPALYESAGHHSSRPRQPRPQKETSRGSPRRADPAGIRRPTPAAGSAPIRVFSPTRGTYIPRVRSKSSPATDSKWLNYNCQSI